MNAIVEYLSNYVLVGLLLVAAIAFTVATRGVQFRMAGEMLRLLARSGSASNHGAGADGSRRGVSSFQAFALSIASRVGTGNLAGVAIAISMGGPGAVFWMWVIALLGAATSFVESTLAQLYKVKGEGSFLGGPAYYIQRGLGQRWWAVLFAVLITLTFGIAFNAVQSQTISDAFAASFGIPSWITGAFLTGLTLAIIFGGIRSIARFSQWVVPVMAVAYVVLALVIVCINIAHLPAVLGMIFANAFGADQALGGTMGAAVAWGIKRGLFSNEAGEGSTPCAAATAAVSHPVKQGLLQALGVFTDTLVVCSATAFIILCSDAWKADVDGIVMTQTAIDSHLGLAGAGSMFISVAIFFFAFTSIVANYYYGESNLLFICRSRGLITAFRILVGCIVMIGAVSPLTSVWAFADVTMALMTICNLAAIALLGKYAIRCLRNYQRQRRQGIDPVYTSDIIPEIADATTCWAPEE